MTVKYCPFQETVPVSLQVCLTMSQKILETFEGIDKKDLNQEKIASTVSLIKQVIDTNVLGSSLIWICRILNICYCFSSGRQS